MEEQLHTTTSLQADFQALGITPGMALIVHSSLKSLGKVIGGPVAVILALEQALGPQGTLVMPTFSEHLCDPAEEENHYPEAQRELVRQNLPFYFPDLTPTSEMGFIVETFRKQNGVRRSAHPHLSFAAWGRYAGQVTANHTLDCALGEQSPLGRLYQLGGSILLLGAPKTTNSALHLAEYRQAQANPHARQWDVLLEVNGERCWSKYHDIINNCDDFGQIFDAFAAETGRLRQGRVGAAQSYLLPLREMVDFAQVWMDTHRA